MIEILKKTPGRKVVCKNLNAAQSVKYLVRTYLAASFSSIRSTMESGIIEKN